MYQAHTRRGRDEQHETPVREPPRDGSGGHPHDRPGFGSPKWPAETRVRESRPGGARAPSLPLAGATRRDSSSGARARQRSCGRAHPLAGATRPDAKFESPSPATLTWPSHPLARATRPDAEYGSPSRSACRSSPLRRGFGSSARQFPCDPASYPSEWPAMTPSSRARVRQRSRRPAFRSPERPAVTPRSGVRRFPCAGQAGAQVPHPWLLKLSPVRTVTWSSFGASRMTSLSRMSPSTDDCSQWQSAVLPPVVV